MEIRIDRLTLENFKCHKFLALDFAGQSVSIYGDNATGKTSIYDALTWLLFGKDSAGNGEKNIDIKPLNEAGEVRDHQAITSVEAQFLADGVPITLKRTYREIWTTRRGSGEAVYEGNTSDYSVDGVPQKKNAFDARVRELVPEDLFRMLTSVSWFAAGMKWQDRRAVLFDMTGVLTDGQIMAQDPRFQPLQESMGRLTVAEYRAKLNSQKKGLTGVRDDAPTRINECTRTLEWLQGLDFDAAREEERALLAKREAISKQLVALDTDSALVNARLALREAKLEWDDLKSRNMAHRAAQNGPQLDIAALRKAIGTETMRLSSDRAFLDTTLRTAQRYERELAESRAEYVKVNGEAFAGGVCPTCGQALPFEQLQEATRAFNQRKEERLAQIMERANKLKEEQRTYQEQAQKLREAMQERESRIAELDEKLRKAKEEAPEVTDMPGFAEGMENITQKINGLEARLQELTADSSGSRTALLQEQAEVDEHIRRAQAVIAKEPMKEQTLKRVEELRTDARNAAEALEKIEKMLYLMEEFTRHKARFVEGSVNGLFRLATFRLFREQANGGLEERCDAQYNGVPFTGLNNGMKINVGIDIINALSRHYGVRVPLFIDNAESVTRLEDCGTQVIRLVVSENDKELRIV